jgi:hypothetical protein
MREAKAAQAEAKAAASATKKRRLTNKDKVRKISPTSCDLNIAGR